MVETMVYPTMMYYKKNCNYNNFDHFHGCACLDKGVCIIHFQYRYMFRSAFVLPSFGSVSCGMFVGTSVSLFSSSYELCLHSTWNANGTSHYLNDDDDDDDDINPIHRQWFRQKRTNKPTPSKQQRAKRQRDKTTSPLPLLSCGSAAAAESGGGGTTPSSSNSNSNRILTPLC